MAEWVTYKNHQIKACSQHLGNDRWPPKALAWLSTGSREPMKTLLGESHEISNTEKRRMRLLFGKPRNGWISVNRLKLTHCASRLVKEWYRVPECKFIDLWHSPPLPMYPRPPNCLRARVDQLLASLPRSRQNLVFRLSLRLIWIRVSSIRPSGVQIPEAR